MWMWAMYVTLRSGCLLNGWKCAENCWTCQNICNKPDQIRKFHWNKLLALRFRIACRRPSDPTELFNILFIKTANTTNIDFGWIQLNKPYSKQYILYWRILYNDDYYSIGLAKNMDRLCMCEMFARLDICSRNWWKFGIQ